MILRTTLTGERELSRELLDADGKYLDLAYATLNDTGRQLRSLTSQLAPEADGFLSNTVRMEEEPDGSGWEVGWFAEDFNAAGFDPYFWFVEFGTVDTQAQPSLGPAWSDLEPDLIRKLENDLLAAFA